MKDPAEYPCLLSLVMSAADHLRDEIADELARAGYPLDELERQELAQRVEDRAFAFLVSARVREEEPA